MAENILENLWSGIISSKYEAYLQPQYNIFTSEIVGYEALARLNDPDGVVSPGNFLSVLEKNGMIVELDSFIFELVCKFLRKCIDNEAKLFPVSVNLSRADFYEDDFIENLEKIRKKYGISAKLIGIELSEKFSINDRATIIEVVKKFHQYGYVVRLDRFSTLSPSLTSVVEMNFDVIKLDMVLLNEDFISNNGRVIAEVLRNAQEKDIVVIAQGIETKEQVEFLESLHCRFVQGYFYARPMAEKEAYALIKKEDDAANSLVGQEKSYKHKFEDLLEQVGAYYWEYVVDTKEVYPCYRCVRDFGLTPLMSDYPNCIIQSGFVPKESAKAYRELFSRINEGEKHAEDIIPMTEEKIPYIIRCDTEFDDDGKPVLAYCSAVKVIK